VKPSERVKWLREELARHNDAYFKRTRRSFPTPTTTLSLESCERWKTSILS